jgi:hypothetical protein
LFVVLGSTFCTSLTEPDIGLDSALIPDHTGELPVSPSGPIEQSDNTTKVISIVDE